MATTSTNANTSIDFVTADVNVNMDAHLFTREGAGTYTPI